MIKIKTDKRIILALDVSSPLGASELMGDVVGQVEVVKIGLELINRQVADSVAHVARMSDFKIFWDAKLNDIPRTVGRTVESIVENGTISMFTVHSLSGPESVRAAVNNRGKADVIAVTLLTSISDETAKSMFGLDRGSAVTALARSAKADGVQGIVCSARELPFIRSYPDLNDLQIIVCGTRSPGVPHDDQANVTTPAEAIGAGADWVVIGREIVNAHERRMSPFEAARDINDSISEALQKRG